LGGCMTKFGFLKAALAGGVSAAALSGAAFAANFNIPGGDLEAALNAYASQAGVQLIVSDEAVKGTHTRGAQGELTASAALSRILDGTGFATQLTPAGVIAVVRAHTDAARQTAIAAPVQVAEAAPVHAAASVETIVVTSSKIKGDIQTVPIAITALSQEQLTSRQIAGGPDLVKEVPNLTFTKTNFTGYSIQIRGIGTQAISVATDPAVAVSFNDIPFLRNHFFEQEFFDVAQVEVVRGPQGTLYGRNATAGVVNVISAKPTDHYEVMASADWGNYTSRRYEGMANVPIWSDKIDLRVAGEWTKRDGYSFNEQTNKPVDGRDLWSSRVSLLLHPVGSLTANLVWEHFQEDDDRIRSSKQLCEKDQAPASVNGPAGPQTPSTSNFGTFWLEQGCKPASLYSPLSYETPNAGAIPFVAALYAFSPYLPPNIDPYAGQTQSRDLRVIDSLISPKYTAKNDTFEANIDFDIASALTLTSQTGYNKDSLYSTEDFNRFDTRAGIFVDRGGSTLIGQDGMFCDPQLGCSDRLVGQDISEEHARQFYQELRLTSDFKEPFNFVAGANYLDYRTLEDFYVLSNAITIDREVFNNVSFPDAGHIPFNPVAANACGPTQVTLTSVVDLSCGYVDPDSFNQISGQGHNYFRSQNPYWLKSWALFGEAYYQLSPDVKLTGGLRYTDDKKIFDEIPSWTLWAGEGYITTSIIRQEWRKYSGRAVVNWTPKLNFTDQTLVYASFAHGYKGGGANPPGTIPENDNGIDISSPSSIAHPLTFKPEFNNAFELGTKNTMFDGDVTLNGDIFFYKYENYQISEIVDRTAINLNFNSTVDGAEIETTWSPIAGLKFGFSGGYEDTRIDNGQSAIDLMDRTAGHSDWMVVKPFITATSNCVMPTYVVNEMLGAHKPITISCYNAYTPGIYVPGGVVDPATLRPYAPFPSATKYPNYPGFDPLAGTPGDPYTGQNIYDGHDYGPAPNGGEGFAKNVGGNQLPNAPHLTTSLTADFTMPVSDDWAATLHSDFYWQSQSFARIFNDRPYDKLRGYSTANLALIMTSAGGWQVIGYVKNVFDVTAITGAFLNSDDSSLTTNVFLTDPRLYGVRVTKNF